MTGTPLNRGFVLEADLYDHKTARTEPVHRERLSVIAAAHIEHLRRVRFPDEGVSVLVRVRPRLQGERIEELPNRIGHRLMAWAERGQAIVTLEG